MKCICIAGATQSDLDVVSDILQQAGMKPPKPTKRDEPTDIASWHEQVLAMEAEAGYAIANPGRFMEQLASDIFVANLKSNPWGWADTRSTWMLDFWLNFDPNIYFVLVCVSPQQMLASAMMDETEEVSIETVMDSWQVYYQQILRFHHRNPQRSLLVDVRECTEYPLALIDRCSKQWKLKLASSDITDSIQIEHDPLAIYLAQQLCQDYPQAASLQRELDATRTRLGEAEQTASIALLSPEQIVADYRALRDRSVELAQLQAAREELADLKVHFDDTVANYEQQQKADEIALNSANQECKLVTQIALEQVDAKARVLESKLGELKETQQENELLLLQLHQVQEELEAIFFKHESAQKNIDQLQTQVTELTQARDEQVNLAGTRYTEIRTLTQEKATLANEKAELITARDEQVKLAGELYLQIESLISERDVALLKCAATQNAVEQQDTQSGLLESERVKLKESQQENELLLLQLHQVQEELEHYFLQQQNTQKQVQNVETCLQRILQRNRAYCDYETIELLSDTTVKDGSNQAIWRLTNLCAAGRFWAKLEFKTIIEQGVAGFVFARAQEGDAPFLQWPAAVGDRSDLVLIPNGNRDNIERRIMTLLVLGTSDWDLLQTLSRILSNTLHQQLLVPTTLNASANFQPEVLRAGLEKLNQLFARLPSILRNDQVVLKQEQVKADYEHLWLLLENLAFDGKHWPQFEFRISCANVRPNLFGTHPKLEFPENAGQSPFTDWFVEAQDDYGPKLELRFETPNSMDAEVWQRMTAHDRAFVSAIISRLPAILLRLNAGGTKLNRPLNDWIKMAQDIQRVHDLFTVVATQAAATNNVTVLDKKPEVGTAIPANVSAHESARKASAPKSVRKNATAKTAKASR